MTDVTNKQNEMNISAFLNQYVYADDQMESYNGKTIDAIVSMSEKLKNDSAFMNAYEKHKKDWGQITLISQSSIDGKTADGKGIPMTELIACTFMDKDGNVYVSYRGTGDGKWVDNGDAMANESSLMQRRAEEYFNSVIENPTDASYDLKNYQGGKIIVTGHSKGGNSAQYTTMTSKYGYLIDECYSMDGQGFSQSAIDMFRKKYGEEYYQQQIDKMYSICGHNDYVHNLGISIIKDANTYLFFSTKGDGFMEWHQPEGYFNTNGEINFSYDEANNIISVEQGAVGRFVTELSEQLMTLEGEELENCTVSVMSLLEYFMNDKNTRYLEGTGDIKFAEPEQIVGFINVGIPIIVNAIKNSNSIDDVFKLLNLNISKDHWLVEPLLDIAIEISESITLEEYEGYVSLVNELSTYMKNNGMELTDFIEYIKEDPIRLIGVYASLDLGKKGLHEAIAKIFSPKNISRIVASFMCEHPILTGVAVAALSVPAIRGALVTVAGFVIAAGAVYLIANHIIANWDTIHAKLIEGAEYIKDKIAELYTELKNKLIEQLNNYAEDVLSGIEKIITVGERVINYAVDQVGDFIGYLRDACKVAIKAAFMICNPILYAIASKLYNASKEPVRINMVKLRQCVSTMNRLASRVANIDSRLDNLYYQLSRNNIEQGEGIFTSLANMYNLFRADLNVDEGQAIKRKARALSELFEDCEKTDEWVFDNVPQSI